MLARRRFGLTAGFVALAAAVGCSGGGNGSYATVSGVVTHNGAPVNGAKVTFHSTTETGGQRSASFGALTDSNGKYLLASVGKESGIPPGMYKVTITKPDIKGGNVDPEIANDPGQMEASGMARNTLPKDYENVNTTKLSVTLEAGKNENVNFDMKGKAAAKGTVTNTP
ncbi:MAG TPA: carboxypeptidase-like regulatory domain-containing protein [Fimbriiglobus sp.]|nr:carboxypeptidase-like regulatory domain-containing protein [Fimbriiglobus sp.]